MIWHYFQRKREELASLKRQLYSASERAEGLAAENKRLRTVEGKQYGLIRALQDDVSISGQIQMEVQAKLDDLQLSVKDLRKANYRFLEQTEDLSPDPTPPEPAPAGDALDDLRDRIGLPRDGSAVLRGDPFKAGHHHDASIVGRRHDGF